MAARMLAVGERRAISMIVRRKELKPVDFDGLAIFDYTAGADLDSSLALIEVAPGASHRKAWSRKSDKYYLVTDGQLEFTVDDEVTVLASGDFCYIERGRIFSYRNASPKPATLFLVHTPAFDLSAEVFAE
jgi:mannose-6-phosphate isomerase-like protein (cupin superfamily)